MNLCPISVLEQSLRSIARLVIRIYQGLISPAIHSLVGPGYGCRFEPKCSDFFLEAVHEHGFFSGSNLGVRRILRCHPGAKAGFDPVPKQGAS